MLFIENIILALTSLKNNKLRSALTLLGIAIGLFSIIVVMTAIGAVQSNVEDAFNSIGTNNFIIQKYPAIQMGPHDHNKYRNRENLTIEIGEKLKAMTNLPIAVGISLERGGKTAKYYGEKTNPDVELIGANVDEFVASNIQIANGRGFINTDMDYAKSICILGADVAEKLFKAVDPIGQTIKIDNLSLEVIGVFEKRGSVLGRAQDNFVGIPLTYFKKIYGDERSSSFTIVAKSKDMIPLTMDEVIGALRKIRKVAPGTENDFEIITNDQLIAQFDDITKYFRIGAAVVAFIALIAAGIGIMNIMMVSVTERTREIGIRKAIGARKSAILTQFVIEAIALSQVGGLIGIILGVLGGNIIALLLSVPIILPIDWILIGILVTSIVGVVFGVYPAIKAANLDPIEALRYE